MTSFIIPSGDASLPGAFRWDFCCLSETFHRTVRVRNEQIHLTPIEYKLTHRFLLREVWGPQGSQVNHYLRVFVVGLRRKIEEDSAQPRYIFTEQRTCSNAWFRCNIAFEQSDRGQEIHSHIDG
jgi:hypothetical protein